MSSFRGSGRGGRGGGPPVRRQDTPYKVGPLKVIVNCYPVTHLPRAKFYQYDPIRNELGKQLDNRFRSRKIELVDRLQTSVAPAIFQPKALYDGGSLLFSPLQLKLPDGNSGSWVLGRFTISIVSTTGQVVDFLALNRFLNRQSPKSSASDVALTMTNLLVQGAPTLMEAAGGANIVNYVRAANKKLTAFDKKNIGGGLEFWHGIFQSVRPIIGGLLLNVDITNGIMYQCGPLTDVVMGLLNTRNPRDLSFSQNDANFKKAKSFLKGLFVRVLPEGKRKKIQGLQEFAGEYIFEKDNRPCTVSEHFQATHNITIQHPRIFGIITGSKDFKLVYPAQACTLDGGQFYRKKLSPDATARVVPLATQGPQQRLGTIMNGIGHGQSGALAAPSVDYASSPFLQAAGMTISPSLLEITGEVIQPPGLGFGNSQTVPAEHGKWNMIRKQFFERAPNFTRLTIIDCSNSPDERLANLSRQFNNSFQAVGMAQVSSECERSNGHDFTKKVLSLKTKPQFLLIVLPEKGDDLYRQIKLICEVRLGIMNQCIRVDKISKMPISEQYLANCALKINARLNGANSVPKSLAIAELQKSSCMIVGANVSHPGPGGVEPSITALVWNANKDTYVKYKALTRIQSPRTEMIDDLYDMMKFAISDHAASSKRGPDRIVFYRDGVSEGEFEIVEDKEISAVQSAIDDCYAEWVNKGLITPSPKPKLTFVVVGKRHHIRFFPKDGVGEDKSGNCPAGFMAAKGLQSPSTRDYYLQSHGGLLGTSRPGHYTVLRDDNFSALQGVLEELSFAFCHCYASATRSVSIPAPTYYADHVRTQSIILKPPPGAESIISDKAFDLEPWKARFKLLHPNIIAKMWFL